MNVRPIGASVDRYGPSRAEFASVELLAVRTEERRDRRLRHDACWT
jgi:hypothetical protein